MTDPAPTPTPLENLNRIQANLEALGDVPYARAGLAALEVARNKGIAGGIVDTLRESSVGTFLEGIGVGLTPDPTATPEKIQSTFTREYMTAVGAHLATLPEAQKFPEFTRALTAVDTSGQAASVLATLTPPAGATAEAVTSMQMVQTALMNASTHNPAFLDHVLKTAGTDGPGLTSLLSQDFISNPQFAGPISDILTTIANNPGTIDADGNVVGGYDFEKLDTLAVAANNYFAENAKVGDTRNETEVNRRFSELLASVRDAGGNVPALAGMNGQMLLQFINDLFTGDLDSAIGNLTTGLGLQGQELADFESLIRPIAGLLQFMGQDYYDYGAHYGPQLMASANNTVDIVTNFTQGPGRVVLGDAPITVSDAGDTASAGEVVKAAALDTPPADDHAEAEIPETEGTVKVAYAAPAEYSSYSWATAAANTGLGLDGVDKINGTANDFLSGRSNMLPDYLRTASLEADQIMPAATRSSAAAFNIG
jgi:hypothetical protein